jgi:hypothetical protein
MQYYIGIVTGAILLLGALGILGFGKRVYVNATTGDIIELAVPILGKVKTSSPFIVFALIGFTLIVTCSKLSPTEQLINIDGTITSRTPVDIYFVAVPSSQYHQDFSGSFHTTLPKLQNARYRAKFVINNEVLDDKEVVVVRDQATLPVFRNDLPSRRSDMVVVPDIRTSDDQAKAFLR